MNTAVLFIFAVIAFLATGCAAPITEVVASRQSRTIDQNLFKEGDEVWITYQDSTDVVKTERGFVLGVGDDSVMLARHGKVRKAIPTKDRKDSFEVEYRQVQTLSHPVKNRWDVGLSGGTSYTFLPVPQELPFHELLSTVGISSRYLPYSNQAFEANFSIGRGKVTPLDPWMGMTVNMHRYINSRIYFLWGTGWEWSDLSDWHARRNYDRGKLHYRMIFRLGFGTDIPLPRTDFDARIEAEIGVLSGFRVYFDYRLKQYERGG